MRLYNTLLHTGKLQEKFKNVTRASLCLKRDLFQPFLKDRRGSDKMKV